MSDAPPPPPPPPPPSGQDPFGPAPLESVGAWPRFGARIIDAIVLLIPNLIITAVFADTSGFGGGTVDVADSFLAGVLSTLLGFGYAVYLESASGATVGKRLLGYKVVGLDGQNPSTEMAARRNVWLLLGLIPFLGGLLSFVIVIAIAISISRDPFNRGVHDNFAGGSAVVRAK